MNNLCTNLFYIQILIQCSSSLHFTYVYRKVYNVSLLKLLLEFIIINQKATDKVCFEKKSKVSFYTDPFSFVLHFSNSRLGFIVGNLWSTQMKQPLATIIIIINRIRKLCELLFCV